MKRMIFCPGCLIEFHETIDVRPPEFMKFVSGDAMDNYRCDLRGEEIKQGEKCFAVSIWVEDRGIPYFEWEPGYLEIPGRRI